MYQVFKTMIGGRELVIETGKMAKQANGAVLARYGNTAVLVTATQSKEPRPGIDFFPLTVDYEEKMYSVGKIPGGFIKREGRPPETAVLTGRLIDRPLRPLFKDGMRNDVQVVATVLSVDADCSPEVTAMIAASTALSISDIVFNGPIAGVRIGFDGENYLLNPTTKQLETSLLNMVVAGTYDAILMVEAGAEQLSEDIMLDAIMFAHEEIKKIITFQHEIVAAAGKPKKDAPLYAPSAEINEAVRAHVTDDMRSALMNQDKQQREENMAAVSKAAKAHFAALFPDNPKDVSCVISAVTKEIVRRTITVDKIRPDGRALDEVRPINCEVGLLHRTHGTGLFTRGQTQVLTVTTLGCVGEEQILDGVGLEDSKRYMHHYNFPPFSVGETRPMRGPGRREIGHGALAERALLPVIPDEEQFPYTIRMVSEVLESNGSSSRGSVCGSTLSLMDAGVPIKAPVSGIAMGLVKDGENYSILTDIQGLEDALGDMDFKVAGTAQGVTAIQMDIKIDGLSREILHSALEQAKKGRMHILGKMLEAIDTPRAELSQFAPRIFSFNINPDKIRDVIGPGGKIIKKIIEETGVKIDIEDDGRVFIASIDPEMGEKARRIVEGLVAEVEVGKSYLGKVTRLMQFGAFVEVLPGKEGMVHISQLAHERVRAVEDVVAVGDKIMVKVIEIDKMNRVNLSRKALMPRENKEEQQ